MKRIFTLTILTVFLHIAALAQIENPERWETFLCYHDISHVEPAGDKVYVLANGNIFSYNKNDHSLQEYNKLNALNSSDITHIAWVKSQKKLMIFYSDLLIDVLDERGNTTFIAGLRDYSTSENKEITGISINGNLAYITTEGIGTLKIDIKSGLILETIRPEKIESGEVKIPADERVKMSVEEYNTLSGFALPNALQNNKHLYITYDNGILYSLPGHNDYTMAGHTPLMVQKMKEDDWTVLDQSMLKNYYSDKVAENANSMDIDPKNHNHIMVASNTGMYEYLNDKLINFYDASGKHDSYGNTSEASLTNDNIVSLKYNNDGTLWAFVRSGNLLFKMDQNGKWDKITGPKTRNLGRTIRPFFDHNGLLWFCTQHYNPMFIGFYAPKEDVWCTIDEFLNVDGSNMKDALGYGSYIGKDSENNIWLGSNGFIAYIDQTEYKALLSNVSHASQVRFVQPKVNRNDGTNLADYLLKGATIKDAKWDKAGRMWVATEGNGVFLISPDNFSESAHFTMDNSPLQSDIVYSIALDEASGKVYFGTDKGLYSYQSDVKGTYGDYSDDNVYAYPNPVTPDHTSAISITGLTSGCTVIITNAAGKVVHRGVTSGPTYSGWYGSDASGKRVASGIYYVLVSNKEGESACVTKIAIID